MAQSTRAAMLGAFYTRHFTKSQTPVSVSRMSGSSRSNTLHSSAYVMIACAAGVDGKFDVAEKAAIWRFLSAHADAQRLEDVEAVIVSAANDYNNQLGTARISQLEAHLAYLHTHLTADQQRDFLRSLAAVAQSDGNTSAPERAFLEAANLLLQRPVSIT